jgi:nitroreductase
MNENMVLDCIHARRSTRSFLDRPVGDAELEAILDTAIWAPSGSNSQRNTFGKITSAMANGTGPFKNRMTEIDGMLRRYLTMMSRRSFQLMPSPGIWMRPPLVAPEDVAIRLPERVDLFDAPEDNQALYKVVATHIAGRFEYGNAIGAVNLVPRFSFAQDVNGISPGPGGNFIEGRKGLTVGLGFNYISKWELDLSYTSFSGAGRYNLQNDRDFLAANVKFTF